MDRLRDVIDESLGNNATLTTRALFERTVQELQAEGKWKQAWDVAMDWNDWLATVDAQDREPRQSAVDVEMRSRSVDIAYEVVRTGEDEPLPTTDDDAVDHAALEFTSSPATVDVDTPGEDDDG